jgi:hypothetical protein
MSPRRAWLPELLAILVERAHSRAGSAPPGGSRGRLPHRADTLLPVMRMRLFARAGTGLPAGLLALALPVAAVTTNDVATAAQEGRELARHLCELRPAENCTNTGTLIIRAPKQPRRALAFRSRVSVTASNWTSHYEAAAGTNPPFAFGVEFRSDTANVYQLDATNFSAAAQPPVAFASSDFWLTDLALEFFRWPSQHLTRRELKRGQSCAVLESRNPAPAPGDYSRVVSWIDADTSAIVQAEAYDANGKLLKEFRPSELEKVNGQWQVKELEIENVQTGSRTKLVFDLKAE